MQFYIKKIYSVVSRSVVCYSKKHKTCCCVALDDDIQSAQDYSLVVENPPADASDPDEWYDFFSRFGVVRYVTVNRENTALLKLLLEKRLILRQFPAAARDLLDQRAAAIAAFDVDGFDQIMWYFGIGANSQEYLLRKLAKVNDALSAAVKQSYEVCSIYITFETESEKVRCTELLNIERSLWNHLKSRVVPERRFRGHHVLQVEESSEPDNISWLNAGITDHERAVRISASYALSAAVLYCCFLLVTSQSDPTSLVIVISILDNILPSVFAVITGLEGTVDEDDRQNSYMIKLYAARMLTAVLFPFMDTPWATFPDVDTIIAKKNVQISSCFASPIVKLLDINGFINRHVFVRLFASNQADANRCWSGGSFTLAERYTDIAKVSIYIYFNTLTKLYLFSLIALVRILVMLPVCPQIMTVTLFYSFLDPTTFFIAAIACLNIYLIDRYLLLRNSSQPPMLDNSMGPTVRRTHLSFRT